MHGGPIAREAFVADLASNLGVDLPAASQLVDRAASLGRVEGASSRRLSEAGATLYSRLWAAIRQVQARLYADIDPSEVEITRRVLAEVARRANGLLTI